MSATVLSSIDELAALIQPEKIAAQGFLRPAQVAVSSGTNHAGDAAFYIYLVYPDKTPEAVLSWNRVKPMVRWVRNEIWKMGGKERWPYVRVLRQADFSADLL